MAWKERVKKWLEALSRKARERARKWLEGFWEEAQEPVFQSTAPAEIAFGAAITLGLFCGTVGIVGAAGLASGRFAKISGAATQELLNSLRYSVSAGAQISAAVLFAPVLLALSVAQLLRGPAGDAYALLLVRARTLYWPVGAALGGMGTMAALWLGVGRFGPAEGLLAIATLAVLIACYVVYALRGTRRRWVAMVLLGSAPVLLAVVTLWFFARGDSMIWSLAAAVPIGVWAAIMGEAIISARAVVYVLPALPSVPREIIMKALQCIASAETSRAEDVRIAAVEEGVQLVSDAYERIREAGPARWIEALASQILYQGMTQRIVRVAATWYGRHCAAYQERKWDRWLRKVFPWTATLYHWTELVREVVANASVHPITRQEVIARVVANYVWAAVCSPAQEAWDNPWRWQIAESLHGLLSAAARAPKGVTPEFNRDIWVEALAQVWDEVVRARVPDWAKDVFSCTEPRLDPCEFLVGVLIRHAPRPDRRADASSLDHDYLECLRQLAVRLAGKIGNAQGYGAEAAKWVLRLSTQLAAIYLNSGDVEGLRRLLWGSEGENGLVDWLVWQRRPVAQAALAKLLAQGVVYGCCELWTGEQRAIVGDERFAKLTQEKKVSYRRCFGELLLAAKTAAGHMGARIEDVLFGPDCPIAFLRRQPRLSPVSPERTIAFAAIVRGIAGLGPCNVWRPHMHEWLCPVCTDAQRWRTTVWAAFRGVNEYLLALGDRLGRRRSTLGAQLRTAVKDVLRGYRQLAAKHCSDTHSDRP